MLRRLLAGALISAGVAGLLRMVPLAHAYYNAYVDLPAGNLAEYDVTSTGQLVRCTVPSQINLKKNQANTFTFFNCTNNFNAPITLNWSVVSDPGGSGVSASGNSGAMLAGTSACRNATLNGTNKNGPYTLIFKGTTASTAGFYAEIEFAGTINLGAFGPSGGCP